MKNLSLNILKCAFAVALIFPVGGLVGCSADGAVNGEDLFSDEVALSESALVGVWISDLCEAYPDGQGGTNYVKRNFEITEQSWDLVFTAYGDEACSYPLFSGNVGGAFGLERLSITVAGATEGTFNLDYNEWTVHAEDMLSVLEQSGCGTEAWEVGVAQDVSTTGCIGVAKPLESCQAEFDVVSVEGDELFFGERITDMCTPAGRPAALNAYAVIRQ